MAISKDEANRQLVRELVPELGDDEVEQLVARLGDAEDARRSGETPDEPTTWES